MATTVALYAPGRIAWVDAQAAIPDGLLGVVRHGVSEDTRRLTNAQSVDMISILTRSAEPVLARRRALPGQFRRE